LNPPDARRPDGHHDVLAAIPSEYRDAVLQQCTRRVVPRHQDVWRQGDEGGHVAFLVAGKAMSLYQGRNGKTGTTGFWSAGALLGAADFATSSRRQMTLHCLEDCVIHTLSHERFEMLAVRFPELALAVIRALSIRLRWVADLALRLETQSAPGRICTVLLALTDRFGTRHPEGILIDLSLKHEEIAAIAGVTRQFVHSTLRNLRDRGALKVDARRMVVSQREALEALADGD
jgi:CRP/FNR family cyclic AMP-dependent transcriptional regulator